MMGDMRLQKFLAQSGIASRRKAEELIKNGRVFVNGERITAMGHKVSNVDCVKVDGRIIHPSDKMIYIALNKPEGYVTTVKDQFSRKTVIDLVSGIKERIYPVGRLDYDTSGLILLTNDGEFAYRITHPKYEIKKTYLAKVAGNMTNKEINMFQQGLIIDGYLTSPSKLSVIKKNKKTSLLEITIHEGKNRQVRKMCEAIGHPVISLKRIAIGPIRLSDIAEGKWRYLTREEVEYFKNKQP